MALKTAIIGAGFSGLAAANKLRQAGGEVVVFDSLDRPGGLASGFSQPDWDWSIEHHYHHVFESDRAVKQLLLELGLSNLLFFDETTSSTLDQSELGKLQLAPLDSPWALLNYPGLSLLTKLRTGLSLAVFKLIPFGKFLERFTAKELLIFLMGQESWQKLWQPLFAKKFGSLADSVNGAWFWARIKARSKKLGYFKGGFLALAQAIEKQLVYAGVEFKYSQLVSSIKQQDGGWIVSFVETDSLIDIDQEDEEVVAPKPRTEYFDQILFTGQGRQLLQLLPVAVLEAQPEWVKQVERLKSLAAMTLVLELEQALLPDNIYWLNINHPEWPFLAVVDHTNWLKPDHYADHHLVYVGNYLDLEDDFFQANKQQVYTTYAPFIKQLNTQLDSILVDSWLFKAGFAQPIPLKNHSQRLPQVTTPWSGLYWAGMEHIYPYDRGINHAIELGQSVAKIMS